MPEPELITLHIHRYDFTILRRYQAGHPLTEAEAKALNQLMTENIRNNVVSWIRTAESEVPDGIISPDTHQSLQGRIYNYALDYQFQGRNRQRPTSALDIAIDELAFSQAEAEGIAAGFTPESPEVQLRYRHLLSDPDLKTRARTIVDERIRLAKDHDIAQILSV